MQELVPFIRVMQRRRDPEVIPPPPTGAIPAWLVPATKYTFKREKAFNERGRGTDADFLGGYNTISEEESLAVQRILWTEYDKFYWKHEIYCSAVLGPACLVVITAKRRKISLVEAEKLLHELPEDSPPL